MALGAATGLSSYDIRQAEDLSPVLAAALRLEPTLISRIGWGEEVTNTKYEWRDDQLGAITLTGAEPMDDAETDLTVTAGHENRLRIGALIGDHLDLTSEIMQVTAIDTGGHVLTVVRGYGYTVAQTHNNGATYVVISQPRPEGADASFGVAPQPADSFNYCQIFQEGVQIAGTTLAVNPAVVTDEKARQIANATRKVKEELARNLIYGARNLGAAAGGNDSYRTFGGLLEFLTSIGSGNFISTPEEFTEGVLNTMITEVFRDGGHANIIAVPTSLNDKMVLWSVDQVRITQSETQIGRIVDRFRSRVGHILEVVIEPYLRTDIAMVLDTSRIKLHALQGRNWQSSELAKTGDSLKSELIGEFTLEVRNPNEAHCVHQSLS